MGDEEEKKFETFKCKICGYEEEYVLYGRCPADNKYTVFKEDCYIKSDPFSPPKEKQFVVLGSNCAICAEPVCQANKCSIFYDSRFCLPCAEHRKSTFPEQIRKKIINLK